MFTKIRGGGRYLIGNLIDVSGLLSNITPYEQEVYKEKQMYT